MRIGLIGGGQLAQMLALAGRPLGMDVVCLADEITCPAASVALIIPGQFDNPTSLQQLAEQVDVISFEFENVDIAALQTIADKVAIYPNLTIIATAQDRLLEKQTFNELAIPTTRFFAIHSHADLIQAVQTLGFPCVLKTTRLGYDGKGQMVLRSHTDVDQACHMLGKHPLILEEFISFDRELSLIAVRNLQGEIAYYPLTENQHQDGILRVSCAPYTDDKLQQLAQMYLKKLLEKFNYVGVLTVEFFQCGDQLIANEMAPRVHNSGHWTIEGATISQFENHLRAISGLPLGSTESLGHTAMVNFIGTIPAVETALQIPELHYHDYNKAARVGRKLGHATVCAADQQQLEMRLQEILALLKQAD